MYRKDISISTNFSIIVHLHLTQYKCVQDDSLKKVERERREVKSFNFGVCTLGYYDVAARSNLILPND